MSAPRTSFSSKAQAVAEVVNLRRLLAESEQENARLLGALARALPMLRRLGDFVGNGEQDPSRPGSLGARCDLIGDIYDLLEVA